MTTINDIEDLIRVLDENPQWLEILRARILTREVMELPQRLSELAAGVAQQAERHEESNNQQFAALNHKVESYQAANNARFDRVDQLLAANSEQIAANSEQIAANGQRIAANSELIAANGQQIVANRELIAANSQQIAANSEQIAALIQMAEQHERDNERNFRNIYNDLAYLKGNQARYRVLENVQGVAEDMGLKYVRRLTHTDLRRMIQAADTADIPANELDSFGYADLIMEAVNAAGEPCYIAMEISYTADRRDTRRAIRNAGFLTRFTGREAYPAVAGVQRDNEILHQLESGEVFWHPIPRRDMEAE